MRKAVSPAFNTKSSRSDQALRACEAFEVRHDFFGRREVEPEDTWSSYEIAQPILILIGNDQSSRLVLVSGCPYDRVAHTRAMNLDSHNITIGFRSCPDTLAEASRFPNVC